MTIATGTRVRTNFVEGTLDAALTADVADVTMSSAGLADLPVIDHATTSEYAVVAIGQEIVHVTAHTSGATTATVERAQEGTTVAAHASGGSWLHGPTADDFDSLLEVNHQTGTAYTLALADAGLVVEMNNASANTVTVPANATVAFEVGTVVEIMQYGAGQTSVVADTGVTIRSRNGLNLAGQYASASLRKRATDEWALVGDVKL